MQPLFRYRSFAVVMPILLAMLALMAGPQPAVAEFPYHGNTNRYDFYSSDCRYYDWLHCTAVFKILDEEIQDGNMLRTA